MSHSRIEILDPVKLPLIQKLYKLHYPSGKAKSDELTLVSYTEENQISGVVRIRILDKFRLLTGMLVIPEHRNKRIGHQLMGYCKNEFLTDGDYCFAYSHLEQFYGQHRFIKIDKEELPAALRTLFERYSRKKALIPMKYSIM